MIQSICSKDIISEVTDGCSLMFNPRRVQLDTVVGYVTFDLWKNGQILPIHIKKQMYEMGFNNWDVEWTMRWLILTSIK